MTILDVAMICHEANAVYCRSIGDQSQAPWCIAEDWQQQSSINGVLWKLANLNAPCSAQHDSWMAQKIKDGWKYGEIKNAILKTHPCLVPYDQLPLSQQAKDALFSAIVLSLRSYIQ